MEAIVLAGGFGTRLRSVVSDVPKPMAPIAGIPFLEILLNSLLNKGFSRVVLSLGCLADKVVSYFGNSFRSIELVYEIEKEPLGTGGAIRQALKRCKNDHAFIFNGDTFLDLEVIELEAHWQKTKLPIIVACKVFDCKRYGRIETKSGQVVGYSEKSINGPGLINAGCYVLPTDLLDGFGNVKAFSIESDFLATEVYKQRFDVFVTRGLFIDIGVPEEYERAQTELRPYI